jgi:hypothetical protein
MKIFFIVLGSVLALILLGISCEIANRVNNKQEWKSLADDRYPYSTVLDLHDGGKYKLESDKPITDTFIKEFKKRHAHLWQKN